MTEPRERGKALDLFCGAGGASMGLYRAGYDVTGVDIAPQRHYPFTFVQADAMTYPLDGFDLIWASPPCQSYSDAMRHLAKPQPKLIDAVRERLVQSGALWVIENVPGAPLRTPLMLCGTAFGMRVHRHRLFESPFAWTLVPACDKRVKIMNPHRAKSRERMYAEFGKQDVERIWGREMGVPWMGRFETREAIPPVYAEFIARQALGCAA